MSDIETETPSNSSYECLFCQGFFLYYNLNIYIYIYRIKGCRNDTNLLTIDLIVKENIHNCRVFGLKSDAIQNVAKKSSKQVQVWKIE